MVCNVTKTFSFVYIFYGIPSMHYTCHRGIRHLGTSFAKQNRKLPLPFYLITVLVLSNCLEILSVVSGAWYTWYLNIQFIFIKYLLIWVNIYECEHLKDFDSNFFYSALNVKYCIYCLNQKNFLYHTSIETYLDYTR